jgi:hypothetical protein
LVQILKFGEIKLLTVTETEGFAASGDDVVQGDDIGPYFQQVTVS